MPEKVLEYTSRISYFSNNPVHNQNVTLSSKCTTKAAAIKFIP